MPKRRTLRQKVRRASTSRTRRKKRNAVFIIPKLNLTEKQTQDLWGVFLAIFAILLGLATWDSLGIVGNFVKFGLLSAFGIGTYALPFLVGALSVSFFFAEGVRMSFSRVLGIIFLAIGGLGLLHISLLDITDNANLQAGGGFLGASFSGVSRIYLGNFGAGVIHFGIAVMGIILTFPVSIKSLFFGIVDLFFTEEEREEKKISRQKKPISKGEKEEKQKEEKPKALEIVSPESQKKAQEEVKKEREKKKKELEIRKAELEKKKKNEQQPLISEIKEWEFPSLDLLDDSRSKFFADEKLLNKKAKGIQKKLMEFGIGSDLGPVHVGPAVTQFTLKPDEGIKLNKITGLKNDLTLALSTPTLRIEAPIPGKDLVGIEIPNEERTTVHLREILESEAFEKYESSLRLAFGRDVSGEPVVYDLAEMPHLLIAGATGAGKSVGMNTFLMSLLYQNSPADLKMILVDPKRVELGPYNNIPHLLTPVITEADQALAALRWAVSEMMKRYGELAKKGYRNLKEYNEKEEEKMPKIIIVIDELADLMMRQLKKDTEAAICRLAQMARAVGMHLIIATQRPSVDVITGLIKANVPTRISFAVTSSVDSRTILDSVGAEDLLGKGDMLFSNSSLGKPRRIQGIYVDGSEINRVTNHLKFAMEPSYDDSILAGGDEDSGGMGMGNFGGTGGGGGDINEQAIEVIRATGKASASLLQRRLSVGYARAARILDELEEQGYIGPSNGSKPREIYL